MPLILVCKTTIHCIVHLQGNPLRVYNRHLYFKKLDVIPKQHFFKKTQAFSILLLINSKSVGKNKKKIKEKPAFLSKPNKFSFLCGNQIILYDFGQVGTLNFYKMFIWQFSIDDKILSQKALKSNARFLIYCYDSNLKLLQIDIIFLLSILNLHFENLVKSH